jgi:hypothetical protein
MYYEIIQLLWYGLLGLIVFFIGWVLGYNEGRADQKEILVRLRKSIDANRQG